MNTSERILNGIKQALTEGESKVNLVKEQAQQDVNEASQLTGSGLGKGGKTYFDDAFAALRYANPFRQGSRQIVTTNTSAVQFVAKTGNVLDATGSNNPWGYTFTPNDGEPGIATSIWQIPTKVISAQLPLRTALLSDINNIDESIVKDLILEFSANEAQSMALNNDQAGSTTVTTGATSGLRGIFTYPTSTSAAAYGSSGTAVTNGLHTILKVDQAASAIAYDDVNNLVRILPAQYWALPGTAFHIHPSKIHDLRNLKGGATNEVRLFAESGDEDGAAVGYMFGFPVIPNPYMDYTGAGKVTVALANWDQFLTIADGEEITLKRYDQTAPGYVTLYAEKRLVSTIRNPFAGVFLTGV
jgi:HK97 family phage major capsid protein